jgi:hypothetical protein
LKNKGVNRSRESFVDQALTNTSELENAFGGFADCGVDFFELPLDLKTTAFSRTRC